MPRSAKSRWTVRTVAAALLLSLALHALLFLALWFWPMRTRSPTLAIESTRITLDTCILDSPSATLLAERDLPPDLLDTNASIALAPRVETPSPVGPVRNEEEKVRRGEGGVGREEIVAPHSALRTPHSLFPLPATAASVVYVLDRSLTMGADRKLDYARRELIASLRRLPRSVRFQVIDYNEYAESLIVDGQRDLLPAEPAIVDKAVSRLRSLDAAGATNHLAALCRGVDLRPDVLYFLTDAENLQPQEVAFITRRNHRSIIHTIELTRRRASQPEGPLVQLARDNRGTYRRVAPGD